MVIVASQIAIRLILIGKFPALKTSKFEITSPQTNVYNCIAWAAEDDQNFLWPTLTWPHGVSRKVTRASFIKMFAGHGYKVCKDGAPEAGYQKIVLYEDADGVPTHAARLLNDGYWTSKLGPYVDISHTLDGLNGDEYGAPAVFMRRQI